MGDNPFMLHKPEARHDYPPVFGGAFLFVRCFELIGSPPVRKNRRERFLTSAPYADGPEGVRAGQPE